MKNRKSIFIIFLLTLLVGCASFPLPNQTVIKEMKGSSIDAFLIYRITTKLFNQNEVSYNQKKKETQIVLILDKYSKSKWLPVTIKIKGNKLVGRGTNNSPNTQQNQKYIEDTIYNMLKSIENEYYKIKD